MSEDSPRASLRGGDSEGRKKICETTVRVHMCAYVCVCADLCNSLCLDACLDEVIKACFL